MILVDTGPFIALFDPKDRLHSRAREVLQKLRGPFATTLPVLTEAFHILTPSSLGSENLRAFVLRRGVSVWRMDEVAIARAFHLMETYRDQDMDLADASLITSAEFLKSRKVFTFDRADFSVYRIRKGYRQQKVEIIG